MEEIDRAVLTAMAGDVLNPDLAEDIVREAGAGAIRGRTEAG